MRRVLSSAAGRSRRCRRGPDSPEPCAARGAASAVPADRRIGVRRSECAVAAPAFSIPIVAAGLAIAYLQRRWFGSALRSGYGTAQEIYSRSNFAPNAALYTKWLVDTHGPWLLAAPVACLWPGVTTLGRARLSALRWLLLFAALVCAAYLFYSVFETWTYLRFLLPAMAIAMIAVAALVLRALARRARAARSARHCHRAGVGRIEPACGASARTSSAWQTATRARRSRAATSSPCCRRTRSSSAASRAARCATTPAARCCDGIWRRRPLWPTRSIA